MTSYTWNGAVGSYLDPAQWTPNDVPLYGADDAAMIGTGTVTLSDAEPNNITLTLGSAQAIPVVVLGEPTSAPPPPTLVLSNGALGPDMTLDAVGQSTIEVVGYDTNYGTIEATHDPSTAGGSFLAFTIQPNSQLNNEGTISADSTVSAATGSRSASLDFENGASRTPAVLNNDGQINILNDSTASITTTTIGTGAITLARTDGAETNAHPNLTFSEGQVAASQSVALEAGQMTLYQDLGAA